MQKLQRKREIEVKFENGKMMVKCEYDKGFINKAHNFK